MLHSLDRSTVVVNSKPIRTRDYSVELQRSGPAALPAIYHNFHMVAVILSGEALVARERGGDRRAIRFAPGESSVHAAGAGARVTWHSSVHCLYLHLHPRLIRTIGNQLFGASALSLTTRPWLRDPMIRNMGFELEALVRGGAPHDPRLAHELVMAMAHHVTVSYSMESTVVPRVGTMPVEEILDAFRDDIRT